MEAILVENFLFADWKGPLSQQIRLRYPGAKVEDLSAFVALVRLNNLGTWQKEDEEFWNQLAAQKLIQRWEPLETVPPPVRHNKAVYEDIGYQIGSGERLTLKQQELLFSQLHHLEMRAEAAEREAKEQQDRADLLEEDAARTVERHNRFAHLLSLLEEEYEIKFTENSDKSWNSEDLRSGRILARNASLQEAYRAALHARLKEQNT
jgi:hypothetical protein